MVQCTAVGESASNDIRVEASWSARFESRRLEVERTRSTVCTSFARVTRMVTMRPDVTINTIPTRNAKMARVCLRH